MQPEKFIKKIRSVAACNPDLNVVNPPYPTVDAYTKEGSTPMITRDINAEFENLYGKTLNLTRQEGSHTRYQDPQTEVIYRAFRMAFAEQRKAIQRAIGAQKKSTVSGPFIIGMQVEDGTVQFGKRPYRHQTIDKAQLEAQRLVANQNKSCVIFGAVAQVGNVNTPWAMKTDMAIVPYKYERKRTLGVITAELQAIFKHGHPLTKSKRAIKTIDLCMDGSVLVSHNDLSSVVFDTQELAVSYIDKWISEYRAEWTERRKARISDTVHYRVLARKHIPGHAFDPRQTVPEVAVPFLDEVLAVDWIKAVSEERWFKNWAIVMPRQGEDGQATLMAVAKIACGDDKVVAYIKGATYSELDEFFQIWEKK